MATYKYRAINPRGRALTGTLAAANERDLHLQLQQAGITLVDARPAAAQHSAAMLMQRIGAKDLTQLCFNLEQLERAGAKLTDSLRDVIEATSNQRLAVVLGHVSHDVDNGAALSTALAQHKTVFPPLMVALIKAGESTGHLANAFHDLMEHFQWQERLRARLTRVATYPLFSLFAMLGVVGLMLCYVIPETSSFLYSLNVPLPTHTLVLISLSSFVAAHGLAILSLLLLVPLAVYLAARRSDEMKYHVSGWALRAPLAGSLIRKVNLARFMHTFSLMFGSGLGLIEALDIAERTVGNRVLNESIGVIRDQVHTGNPLSLALRLSGEFPGLVQRMIKIGEETGQLAPALRHVADYYERDVQESVQTLLGAIGPALTLMAGSLLVWVVSAVFLPIYDALPQLN